MPSTDLPPLLDRTFFRRETLSVALELPGKLLRRGRVLIEISEVEAYRFPDDSANHCYRGRTPRNAPMWGRPGQAYVYLCYGLHQMLNAVTQPEGEGAAVLIRAGQALRGLSEVRRRRGFADTPDRPARAADLTTGPGRLAQALGLTRAEHDGHDLCAPGGLEIREAFPSDRPPLLRAGPRIGIDYAEPDDVAAPYRIALADSPFVARPRGLDEATVDEVRRLTGP